MRLCNLIAELCELLLIRVSPCNIRSLPPSLRSPSIGSANPSCPPSVIRRGEGGHEEPPCPRRRLYPRRFFYFFFFLRSPFFARLFRLQNFVAACPLPALILPLLFFQTSVAFFPLLLFTIHLSRSVSLSLLLCALPASRQLA